MNYKTLYSIVLAPIFIALLYMTYTTINNAETMPTDNNFVQLSPSDFRTELENDVILIDVRTQEEQAKYGIIQNEQIHIEYGSTEFEEKIQKLDKSKKYLVYCWHGVRSANTRDYMKSLGFESVVDLKGGIDDWE